MAKPDTYMRLYIADYETDTDHLTPEQDSGYFRLILGYWKRQGPLPDDDKLLARISRLNRRWVVNRAVIESFFSVANGNWHHKRIDVELTKAKDHYKSKVEQAENLNNKKNRVRDGMCNGVRNGGRNGGRNTTHTLLKEGAATPPPLGADATPPDVPPPVSVDVSAVINAANAESRRKARLKRYEDANRTRQNLTQPTTNQPEPAQRGDGPPPASA